MAPTKRYPSEKVDASPLGKPLSFKFSGRSAPNRFLKGAMSERQSSWDVSEASKRGVPSAELINLYRRWGEGEWGVILSGNLMLDYDQLESPGNLIVPLEASPSPSDARFAAYQSLAAAAKAHGSLLVAQVSHPGRQVVEAVNPHPISASDVQLVKHELRGATFAKPRAMTADDIQDVIRRFAHAAQYLEAAGFDGIQLHGAHGYLLAQFLSPTTNLRTDAYGGPDIKNRARLITEIAAAVRKVTRPDFVLSIKINSVEFQDKGITPEEARELATLLEEHEFDFVELSGGSYEKLAFEHKRESTVAREAFFIEFAELIAPALKGDTRAYVTGGLKTARAMVAALDVVDGVGLGRAAAQEPTFPKDILSGKIDGAIEPQLDAQNFMATITAAGCQMRQVGVEHQPLDLGKRENADAFLQTMMAWQKELAGDPAKFGYADLNSIVDLPYGTVAVE